LIGDELLSAASRSYSIVVVLVVVFLMVHDERKRTLHFFSFSSKKIAAVEKVLSVHLPVLRPPTKHPDSARFTSRKTQTPTVEHGAFVS